jgi:hypothetical protein
VFALQFGRTDLVAPTWSHRLGRIDLVASTGRIDLAAPASRSTSPGVRFSRVRRLAFGRRFGAADFTAVRFAEGGAGNFKIAEVMFSKPLRSAQNDYCPKMGILRTVQEI